MNRLTNALAFAAIVLAALVMDSNLSPQCLLQNRLVSRITSTLRGHDLPMVASLPDLPVVASLPGLPPQIDEARIERVMARSQAARERLIQAEMRRVAERVRVQVEHSPACNVVKIDQ